MRAKYYALRVIRSTNHLNCGLDIKETSKAQSEWVHQRFLERPRMFISFNNLVLRKTAWEIGVDLGNCLDAREVPPHDVSAWRVEKSDTI